LLNKIAIYIDESGVQGIGMPHEESCGESDAVSIAARFSFLRRIRCAVEQFDADIKEAEILEKQ
jgi:hypothetical protein